MIESYQREADRDDQETVVPPAWHLGIFTHELKVRIVVLDLSALERGFGDVPGFLAIVEDLKNEALRSKWRFTGTERTTPFILSIELTA